MRAFFRFVLVVLLLLVVAMSAAIVTMHFAIHGAEVAIPDFRGMTIPEAAHRAAADHLELHVQNQLYSAEVPPGRVSRQSPAAGTLVRHGWRVWLTESLGPQKITIPNEVGRDQRIAVIEVRRAGMQLGFVAYLPWPAARPGVVIAQSPPPHATGIARPTMNLLVAAPVPPPMERGLVMPSLIGEPFASAAMSLARAGLQQAPVQQLPISQPAPGAPLASAPPPAAGTVVAQNPPSGYRVDATTPVMLTVAQ